MEIESLAIRIEHNNKGIFHNNYIYNKLNDHAKNITPYWGVTASKYEATFLQFYVSSSISPWMFDQFRKYLDDQAVNPDYKFGFTDPDTLFSVLGLTENCYNSQLYLKQFEGLLDLQLINVKAFLTKPIAESREEILFDIKEAKLIEEAATMRQIKSWL